MKMVGVISIVLAVVNLCVHSYYQGLKRGYRQGISAVEEWCIREGRGVDQARQQIWRDEGVKEEGAGWP